MSIINKRRIFSLFAVAVLAGVLTFGASTVTGLDTPGVDPSDNVGVSPTFSGLTVIGDVASYGDLQTVDSSIKLWDDAGDLFGQFIGDSPSGVNITKFSGIFHFLEAVKILGDVDIKGNIQNTNAGHAVYFTDPEGVSISSGLSVNGSIINNSSVVNPVKIADGLNVTGSVVNSEPNTALLLNDDVYVDGNLDINDYFFNSINGAVKIADSLDVTGEISDSDSALVLNDTVDIKNTINNSGANNAGAVKIGDTLNITGEINDSDSALVLNDSVDIKNTINNSGANNGGVVKIGDFADISNDLTVGGLTTLNANLIVKNGDSDASLAVVGVDKPGYVPGSLSVTPYTISNFNHDLILQNGKGYPVQIGNNAKASNLNIFGSITAKKDGGSVGGDLTIDGNLDVKGSAKLKFQIGSEAVDESSTGYKQIVATCPADTTSVVSCGIYFSDVNAQYVRGSGAMINIIGMLFGGDPSCVGSYYQSSVNNVTGMVTATCL